MLGVGVADGAADPALVAELGAVAELDAPLGLLELPGADGDALVGGQLVLATVDPADGDTDGDGRGAVWVGCPGALRCGDAAADELGLATRISGGRALSGGRTAVTSVTTGAELPDTATAPRRYACAQASTVAR